LQPLFYLGQLLLPIGGGATVGMRFEIGGDRPLNEFGFGDPEGLGLGYQAIAQLGGNLNRKTPGSHN
jgi:hypothetical protein